MTKKQATSQAFDQAAGTYNSAAMIQKQAANDLVELARPFLPTSISSWIDLGCGTGFLSEAFVPLFPNSSITLNDLSPAMIREAQTSLSKPCDVLSGDLESLHPNLLWDLVISNCVWQWLEKPHEAFVSWYERSRRAFLCSLLVEGSFTEWEQLHQKIGKKSRLRSLPSFAAIQQGIQSIAPQAMIHQKNYKQRLSSPLEFARLLKKRATSFSQKEPSSLLRLQRHISQSIEVTWNVAFIILVKK